MILRRRGFTVMEVLVATALTLILLGSVVQLFAWMSTSLNDARSGLEMQDRLRATVQLLQRDLRGITVPMQPPRNPADNEGYFEYVEGPMGVSTRLLQTDGIADGAAGPMHIPVNNHTLEITGWNRDYTVTDTDDILMFTTRSPDRPYVGQNVNLGSTWASYTASSAVAEVAWFVRGKTLYRRQLLVAPNAPLVIQPATSGKAQSQTTQMNDPLSALVPGGAYFGRDISMRSVQDPTDPSGRTYRAAANSLGDLTKRENRYGHPIIPSVAGAQAFPYDISRWGAWRMPTKRESWDVNYFPGAYPPPWRQGKGMANYASNPTQWWRDYRITAGSSWGVDFWGGEFLPDGHNPYAPRPVKPTDPDWGPPYYDEWIFASLEPGWLQDSDPMKKMLTDLNSGAGAGTTRQPTDIVMTDVIGFDVKAWDPGAPLYRYTIPETNSSPARDVVLSPGDPGYGRAAGIYIQDVLNRRNPTDVVLVGYGAFVDLGYMPDGATWARDRSNRQVSGFWLFNPPGAPQPHFANVFAWDRSESGYKPTGTGTAALDANIGKYKAAAMQLSRVYDTWSTHYDSDRALRYQVWNAYWNGKPPFVLPDPTNGLDDDDSAIPYPTNSYADPYRSPADYRGTGPDSRRETFFRPPYPYPLRAIQVRIRAFEPTSKQIREITIQQDFLLR